MSLGTVLILMDDWLQGKLWKYFGECLILHCILLQIFMNDGCVLSDLRIFDWNAMFSVIMVIRMHKLNLYHVCDDFTH